MMDDVPEFERELFRIIMRSSDAAFLVTVGHDRPLSLPDTSTKDDTDDGKPWGFVNEAGRWIQVPKRPLILAGLGPPPFWVKMAWDEMRHIVHEPEPPSVA
jgi:hypothetical protein